MKSFVGKCVNLGYAFALERYLAEPRTESAATTAIQGAYASAAGTWASAVPNAVKRMIMVPGFFSSARLSLSVNPNVDFKVFMDMQMHRMATASQCQDLYGVQWYTTSYVDEENLRYARALLRHYCIDGNSTRMNSDPYILTHVLNGDFEGGTSPWTITPAVSGSMQARTSSTYSWIQGRYPQTTQGDTFLWTKRNTAAANVFSQPITGLVAGRFYSLKMYTGDYGDWVAGISADKLHEVTINITGAQVTRSLTSRISSNYHASNDRFNTNNRFWMNYHWRVFKATSSTATLSITDWPATGGAGSNVGQELMFNFVEVQPYFQMNEPLITSTAMSSSALVADNSTQYTVTLVADDVNGAGNIKSMRAMFHNGGSFASGNGRGYLCWGLTDADITRYADSWNIVGNATGGGRWGWNNTAWGSNTYITPISCTTSTAGTRRTVTFTFTVKAAWAPATHQKLRVFADNPSYTGWLETDSDYAIENAFDSPPVNVSTSVGATEMIANDTTQYTITRVVSDADGVDEIIRVRTLLNYYLNAPPDTTASGQYRGYLSWGSTAANAQAFGSDSATAQAATGGGYWSYQLTGYGGTTYIAPVSCSTSTSGTQRTVTWTFRVKPAWATSGPLVNNVNRMEHVTNSTDGTVSDRPSNVEFFIRPATNQAPVNVSTSISASELLADDTSTYTVTRVATDDNGVSDIKRLRVLFNYFLDGPPDTTYSGQLRGYMSWGTTIAAAQAFTNSAPAVAATGGGYWSYETTTHGGTTYITPVSCSTSTSGNDRTVTWTFKVKPAWWTSGPLANNVNRMLHPTEDVSEVQVTNRPSNAEFVIRPGTNQAPVNVSTSVSASEMLADDATTYTVTRVASDDNGVSDIKRLRVRFNDISGQYRGYISWGTTVSAAQAFTNSAPAVTATGGGYWSYDTTSSGGTTYITPVSCSTSTSPATNERTVIWTFKVKPAWWTSGPLSNNVNLMLQPTEDAANAQATNRPSDSVYTIKQGIAVTPAVAPTVTAVSTTSLSVSMIGDTANESHATYAIQETSTGNYVQTNGTLGATAQFQTASAWGTKVVTGLSVNTAYTFRAKSKIGSGTESVFGPSAIRYTLANVPAAPSVSAITSSSVEVDITANGNPALTTFAIVVIGGMYTGDNDYIAADGSVCIDCASGSIAWRTDVDWAITMVVGLEDDTDYTFKTLARNGDNVHTAPGPGTTIRTNLRPPPPVPDFDEDTDVDLDDFGWFQGCLSGPSTPQTEPSCAKAQLDEDTDVDANDLAVFLGCMSGAGVPANSACLPG